jgi:hypothetical protein
VNSFEWAVAVVAVIGLWSSGIFALGYQSGKDDAPLPPVPAARRGGPNPYPAADDEWDRALIGLAAEESERLADTGELRQLLGEHLSPEGTADVLDGPGQVPQPYDPDETGEFRAITEALTTDYIERMRAGEEAYREGLTS